MPTIEQKRQYKQKYKQKQKKLARDFILQLKSNRGCSKCSENRPECLDFHHIRKKKNTISNLVRQGYSLQLIQKEILVCEILCGNCHRKEHSINTIPKFGKSAKYVYNLKTKSQCSICSENNPHCLDYHHKDDNKIEGIGAMTRNSQYSIEDIQEEIDKCILVCNNCHKHIHASD